MSLYAPPEYVTVEVNVASKQVSPKLRAVYYRHEDGAHDASRSHGVAWTATGLATGQEVRITLQTVAELQGQAEHDTVRDGLFGEGTGSGRTTRRTWVLTPQAPEVDAGIAWRPHRMATPEGVLNVSYTVELWESGVKLDDLDPDIRVIPDP